MVDMKKEIETCKKKKRPGETVVFGFAGVRIPDHTLQTALLLGMLKEHKGFLGAHITEVLLPIYIFDTLESTEEARNKAKELVKQEQGPVRPLLVEKKYLEGSSKE